jgi:hypothetical protein
VLDETPVVVEPGPPVGLAPLLHLRLRPPPDVELEHDLDPERVGLPGDAEERLVGLPDPRTAETQRGRAGVEAERHDRDPFDPERLRVAERLARLRRPVRAEPRLRRREAEPAVLRQRLGSTSGAGGEEEDEE